MFDDLLLLKKGGEVVFHGELGGCSSKLISYFEGLGASPMNNGENPASKFDRQKECLVKRCDFNEVSFEWSIPV